MTVVPRTVMGRLFAVGVCFAALVTVLAHGTGDGKHVARSASVGLAAVPAATFQAATCAADMATRPRHGHPQRNLCKLQRAGSLEPGQSPADVSESLTFELSPLAMAGADRPGVFAPLAVFRVLPPRAPPALSFESGPVAGRSWSNEPPASALWRPFL